MRRAEKTNYGEPNPLEVYIHEQNKGKKKRAIVTPLAIMGGVSGALLQRSNAKASAETDKALAIGKAKREADVTEMRFDGVIPINTNQNTYSGQVSDLLDSIVVATTNAGVVIYMETKTGNVTLDVTPKENLEGPDLDAYNRMDHAYFKRAFLNQLNVDFASLENSVAKRVVDNHIKFNNALSKEAGVVERIEAYDYSPVEISKFLEDIKERYEDSAFDSFKDFVQSDIESMFPEGAKVEMSLVIKPENSMVTDRVLKRVHPSALNTFLSGTGIFEPGAARERIDIYYSDKSVAFIYDDKIIHTISTDDMTEGEYEAFTNRDDMFFKDKIEHSLRVGFAKVAGEDPRLESELEKLAEDEKLEIKDIFSRSDIHPIVYFTVLTSRFGDEWIDMEVPALIKAIEVEFGLEDNPIDDVPLNKILSMQVANNSDLVYSSYHAFEKVIRSFNSKPIDFGQREMEDLTLRDLVHGINILNRVTPYNNVYDSFSPDIYDYIVQILVKEEKYMWGVNLSGTEEETQFIGVINLSLVDKLIKHYKSKAKTEEQEEEVARQTDQIFRACVMIIDEIRSRFDDYTGAGKFAEQMAKNLGYPNNIVKRIVSEIVVNLSMDLFMQLEDERLNEQLIDLGYAKEVEE